MEVLLEFCLRRNRVRAASQNHGIQFVELLFRVAKLGRFRCSTRRQRLGKKVEDDALSPEIRK